MLARLTAPAAPEAPAPPPVAPKKHARPEPPPAVKTKSAAVKHGKKLAEKRSGLLVVHKAIGDRQKEYAFTE